MQVNIRFEIDDKWNDEVSKIVSVLKSLIKWAFPGAKVSARKYEQSSIPVVDDDK